VPHLGPALARQSLALLSEAATDTSLSSRLTHITLMKASGEAAGLPPDTALAGSASVSAVLAASVSGSVRQGLRLAAAAGEWQSALALAKAARQPAPPPAPPALATEVVAVEKRHELIVRRYLLKQLREAEAARRVSAAAVAAYAARAAAAAAAAALDIARTAELGARARVDKLSAGSAPSGLLFAAGGGLGADGGDASALNSFALRDAEEGVSAAARAAENAAARLAEATAAAAAAERALGEAQATRAEAGVESPRKRQGAFARGSALTISSRAIDSGQALGGGGWGVVV
jgi:hypothetical protein